LVPSPRWLLRVVRVPLLPTDKRKRDHRAFACEKESECRPSIRVCFVLGFFRLERGTQMGQLRRPWRGYKLVFAWVKLLKPDLSALGSHSQGETGNELRVPGAFAVLYELFSQVFLERRAEEEAWGSDVQFRDGSEKASSQVGAESEHS